MNIPILYIKAMSCRDDLLSPLLADSSQEETQDNVHENPRYGTFAERQRSQSVSSEANQAINRSLEQVDEEQQTVINSGSKATIRQTLSALGYSLGAFAMGGVVGWSSPALPQMEAEGSSPHLTPAQAGWVGSLVCVGALLQGPLTGWVMTRLGRRSTMALACVPCLAGWALMAAAQDVWMLYAGRLLAGVAVGAYSVVVPVYIGEVAAPQIRGALGTFFQMMVVSGIFSMYFAGVWLSWRSLALMGALSPLALALLMLTVMRDSPTSYVARGKPELAKKSLTWLRDSEDVSREMDSIQHAVQEAQQTSNDLSIFNVLCSTNPTIYKPVYLSAYLMSAQRLSGINIIMFYTVDIFKAAGATAIDPSWATAIVGAVQIVAVTFSSLINNRIGRRPVLITTEIILALALAVFGAFSYLQTSKPSLAESLGWLPLASMALFMVAFNIGPGPLAWLMTGEIVPSRAKGAVSGVASIVNWSQAFLVALSFHYLNQQLGTYGTYWLYASFCALGAGVAYLCLPETRGRSLAEVEEAFSPGGYRQI